MDHRNTQYIFRNRTNLWNTSDLTWGLKLQYCAKSGGPQGEKKGLITVIVVVFCNIARISCKGQSTPRSYTLRSVRNIKYSKSKYNSYDRYSIFANDLWINSLFGTEILNILEQINSAIPKATPRQWIYGLKVFFDSYIWISREY